jgi:gliding motility-associated-like protein
MRRLRILAVIVSVLLSAGLQAQFLQNPSFEGNAAGGVPPPGWVACKLLSTPDTHDGSGIWNVSNRPSEGDSYLGLTARGFGGYANDNTTEAAGATLLKPLKQGVCYLISLELAYSPEMTFENLQFNNPAALKIWGGNTACSTDIPVWTSPGIDHKQWKKYSFSFIPETPVSNLMLEANFLAAPLFGNILIDNLKIESVEVSLGEDRFICTDVITRLDVDIPGAEILWNTGSTSSSIPIAETARYWVEVKYKDCVVRDSVLIVYPQPLKTSYANDTTLCPGDSLNISDGTIGVIYHWSDGFSGPKREMDSKGYFDVRISNGCEQIHDTFFVDLDESKCCHLSAPNIFTPNGDYVNDTFYLTADSKVAEFDLKIFNRWGHQVFETGSMNEPWNGYSKNRENSDGEFFWVARVKCRNNNSFWSKQLKGIVTLRR